MLIKPIPFNERAVKENALIFDTLEKIKDFLKKKYSNGFQFGTSDLARHGEYREMAFLYNFRPFLKKYLILSYSNYSHGFARNKTELRQALHLGRKDKVMDFPEN